MDFSDYKGIYVVGALFDGHIRKFTANSQAKPEHWQTRAEKKYPLFFWEAI